MNFQPIDVNEVDVNKIEIRKSKNDKNKLGKMFNVFHDGKRLEVILPEMDAPFGAKILTDFGCKISVPLSFSGMDEKTNRGERLRRAHSKLIEIQNKIRELILANPSEFFKDKKKPEIYNERIKDFIVPSEGKDGKKYSDLFRIEIQRYNLGEKDANKTVEELEVLKKEFISKKDMPLLKDKFKKAVHVNLDNVSQVIAWGTRIKPVLSFAYIWVMSSDQKCTPKWYLVHGMVTSDAKGMELDLNPDEEIEEEEEEEEEVEEVEEDVMDDVAQVSI